MLLSEVFTLHIRLRTPFFWRLHSVVRLHSESNNNNVNKMVNVNNDAGEDKNDAFYYFGPYSRAICDLSWSSSCHTCHAKFGEQIQHYQVFEEVLIICPMQTFRYESHDAQTSSFILLQLLTSTPQVEKWFHSWHFWHGGNWIIFDMLLLVLN